MTRYALGSLGLGKPARRWAAALALLIAVGACGDDAILDPDTTLPPDPSLIEPFVGTWDASVFTATSVADTSIVRDLLFEGRGAFIITIQPSGGYTALWDLGGIPSVEIGQLTIDEQFITLRPTGGDPATSSYVFLQETSLRLEGSSDFDVNLDGVADPVSILLELQRR